MKQVVPGENIVLNVAEVQIALAYLEGGEVVSELDALLRSKREAINTLTTGRGFYPPSTLEEVHARYPHMKDFDVAYRHRPTLIGAFMLCADGQEPFQPEVIARLELETAEVGAIAALAVGSLMSLPPPEGTPAPEEPPTEVIETVSILHL
jgi:hypothetical protein